MEDKFYKDEFEQFLQQQANNHRMYPSDGVWLGIYKKLHGDKKWPGLTLAAFVFLVATIAISVYFSPKPSIFELTAATPAQKTNSGRVAPTASTPLINSINNNYPSTKGNNIVTRLDAPLSLPAIDQTRPTSLDVAMADKDVQPNNDLAAVSLPHHPTNYLPESGNRSAKKAIAKAQVNRAEIDNDELDADDETAADLLGDTTEAARKVKTTTPAKKAERDRDDKNIADNFLKQHNGDIALYTTNRKTSQRNRFSYNVYIAPSISYRKLKEDEKLSKSSNINGPVALNYVADVNKVVRHKPGTGVEAGFGITYHITNTFGIKTGLQFNVRQYSIEAFKSPFEAATIALMSNNGVDTINTYAVYRNNNGYLSTELVNRYYQLSVPVGLEWEVLGSKKVKLNLAASVQPTYIMNNSTYLLSSNFKNYTANNGMLRNWNINSSVEAFMSVKVGDYKWQLGPQFRYQHLPTLISEYPIHEHLMDYGFKIGVSKLIK